MAYRRAQGDMIEVYKIVKEIYDIKTTCNILKYRDKIYLSLTLSDPGYFRQLTIRGGGL